MVTTKISFMTHSSVVDTIELVNLKLAHRPNSVRNASKISDCTNHTAIALNLVEREPSEFSRELTSVLFEKFCHR